MPLNNNYKMSKTIFIKLTKGSNTIGPFNISDEYGGSIDNDVSMSALLSGKSYIVADDVNIVVIASLGSCKKTIAFPVAPGTIPPSEISRLKFTPTRNSCVWTHLKNPMIYNYFYGNISPYIIEYPFAYQYNDEILQNVKDYTKVYKYFSSNILDVVDKIETDTEWFNKAIVYNGQQCSGMLLLAPKPANNLKEYSKYPLYASDSKTITFTKSDNFYQYNTFWSLVKNKSIPLFVRSCESLSIDKTINQTNMDYGKRSFKKDTLRAKDLKIRHILDNRSDANLISQFILSPAQISYK